MTPPTSKPLATLTLLLLPFDIITLVLRFHVRISRKAWGYDDWAMVVVAVRNTPRRRLVYPPDLTKPFFVITTVSIIALAWSGLGLRDDELSNQQMESSLFVGNSQLG